MGWDYTTLTAELQHTEDITAAAAVKRTALEDVDDDAHCNGHAANDVHVCAEACVIPCLAQRARIKNWSQVRGIILAVVRELSSDDAGNSAGHDQLRKAVGTGEGTQVMVSCHIGRSRQPTMIEMLRLCIEGEVLQQGKLAGRVRRGVAKLTNIKQS